MDPVTALSLAVNVATVLDLDIRFGKDCVEVAASGVTAASKERLDLADHTRGAISSLEAVLSDSAAAHPTLAKDDTDLKILPMTLSKFRTSSSLSFSSYKDN